MPDRSLHHLVQMFTASPLAIEPSYLQALVAVGRRALRGEGFTGGGLHAELGAAATRRRQGRGTEARIAVIPIDGVISQRPSSLGASTREIDAAFTSAMASTDIDAILFDVNSPGGTVGGVPELAEKIAAARGVKPTMAVADGMMASAAYWLGSAASEVVATPSAEVGSIGVYMLHEDWSKNMEQEGIAVTAISAGKYKTEGAPWAALGAEAQEFYASRVNEVYGWFVKAVAANRRDTQTAVRDGYGEGRVLGAEQALNAKLVDRVMTFEDAVGRLAARVERRGARADHLRRQLEVQDARGVA